MYSDSIVTFSFISTFLYVTISQGSENSAVIISDADSEPYKNIPINPAIALNGDEIEKEFWHKNALHLLDRKLNHKLNVNRAKNIIFFLGDGLSVPTITAARIYYGQLHNRTGEEEKLFFENFSHTGLSKTYCVDRQVADSACTATAYMCGVKANFQTIGVSAKIHVGDCEGAKQESNRVDSIVKWAQQAGKATGIVTTTRVTHASPAGSYAHVPFRDMESDADVKNSKLNQTSCNFDIAKQLVREEPGKNLKVIMGGGRNKFLPRNSNLKHGTGERSTEDLIEEWKIDKQNRSANATYVTSVDELKQIDVAKTDYLLGLFANSHMSYHLDGKSEEPTLEEMTEYAIKILQKESNGFYLFVEGGKIDHAHHTSQAHIALDETVEFSKAIEKAYKLTKEEETLIVVTADHAHTMSMNGYPARGTNILGLYGKAKDGLPYSTLSYANGPGYRAETAPGKRHDYEHDNMDDIQFVYPALVPKLYETHGGDDVAVYASGPWSHLFSGNYEQNFIPIAEAYAAGIGPSSSRNLPNSAIKFTINHFLLSFICTVIFLRI